MGWVPDHKEGEAKAAGYSSRIRPPGQGEWIPIDIFHKNSNRWELNRINPAAFSSNYPRAEIPQRGHFTNYPLTQTYERGMKWPHEH